MRAMPFALAAAAVIVRIHPSLRSRALDCALTGTPGTRNSSGGAPGRSESHHRHLTMKAHLG